MKIFWPALWSTCRRCLCHSGRGSDGNMIAHISATSGSATKISWKPSREDDDDNDSRDMSLWQEDEEEKTEEGDEEKEADDRSLLKDRSLRQDDEDESVADKVL